MADAQPNEADAATEAATTSNNPFDLLQEVLPKAGLVYSEKGTIGEVLCKPKIIPIKSVSLEALEAMVKAAASADAEIPEQ